MASKLFAARGCHGTRMDDIADVAGLNKATVYHYFASKALILYEIYFKAAEETLACLQDDPRWSARESLYQCTSRMLALIFSNREQGAVYFQENPFLSGGSRLNRSPRYARAKTWCRSGFRTSSSGALPAESSSSAIRM